MATDEQEGTEKPAEAPVDTSACAHASTASKALGARFAELLCEDESHQLGVCGQLGIPWRKHMRWMAADAEAGSDLAEYQAAVVAALDEQRRQDLLDGQDKLDSCHPAKAGAQFNMFRFRHEGRFRRFYEEPQKLELTGKDGGAIETNAAVRYVVALPPEEPEEE